jgi:hypothetical protein
MKRRTSTELGGLVLAVMFFVSGFVWLAWPRERVVDHPTNNRLGRTGGFTEVVSKKGSQIYGVIAMFMGAGIGALVLYRPKS